MTLRVVLDTNVVLSALLFARGRLAWLRPAWQAGLLVPLASRDTLDELVRVLAYPKFGLSQGEVMALLGEYVPFVDVVEAHEGRSDPLPRAPDPDDQKFLALAAAGGATHLVTGDHGLLAVTPPAGLALLTPEAFRNVVPGA